MNAVVLIILMVVGSSIAWAVVTALAGRLLGATVREVRFFIGPGVRIARLGGVNIRVGLLPIGSSVQFLDADLLLAAYAEARAAGEIHEDAFDPDLDDLDHLEDLGGLGSADEESDCDLEWVGNFVAGKRLFDALPLASRLTLQLIGWVPVFFFAQMVLGLSGATSGLLQGFGQIFRFFADPAYSQAVLRWLAKTVAEGHWDRAAATVGLKIIAIDLLPLPIFAGGQILATIATSLRRRRTHWPSLALAVSLGVVIMALVVFAGRLWKALF